jgi:hypothetical protein
MWRVGRVGGVAAGRWSVQRGLQTAGTTLQRVVRVAKAREVVVRWSPSVVGNVVAVGGAAALAVGYAHSHRALCAAVTPGRPANEAAVLSKKHADGEVLDSEVTLDWGELWEVVQPDILALLSAIGAAVGAAVVNVKLTYVLGQVGVSSPPHHLNPSSSQLVNLPWLGGARASLFASPPPFVHV